MAVSGSRINPKQDRYLSTVPAKNNLRKNPGGDLRTIKHAFRPIFSINRCHWPHNSIVPESASKKSISCVARATVLLAALLLSLGPLGLLQAVAWTGMAIDYSARYGVAEGLERTFDGKHPCPLCKEITKARQSGKESKAAVTLSPVKLVCVLAATPEVSSAGALRGEHTYPLATALFAERTDRPALPPPRTLAA